MRKNKFALIALVPMLALAACKKNPVDRLINPNPDNSLSQSSGVFIVYDDELKTFGGLGFIPGGLNQTIDIMDNSAPKLSTNQIRYTWNGLDSYAGTNPHAYAGFALTITPDFTTFDAAQPKNLSGHGYGHVKMAIRGTLASDTYVRVEGPDDGNQATTPARFESRHGLTVDFDLTNEWQEISFPVPSGDFNAVKTFITLSIQYNQPSGTTVPGGGGTIYLDNIRYEP